MSSSSNSNNATLQPKPSSTIDALHRMAAGLDQKTLAAKLADPNR